ncbi:MAG TPA: histidine phosphatase family protein, partial [Thermotoga sp.]|nr:histidine phosphatase family protein [Thermotoga sp.]
VWNEKHLWQGNVDTDLSEEGIIQAKKLALRFSHVPLEAVYTSPLKRAYKTAEEIAKVHVMEPIPVEDLKECDISLWNGLTLEEVLDKYSEEFHRWNIDPEANINGVESLGSLQRRIVRAIKNILEHHKGDIVIVSHALALKTFVSWILGIPVTEHRRFKLENASITVVEFSNDPKILVLNDISHL